MVEARTSDGALAAVDQALGRWVDTATALLIQAATTANVAADRALHEVRRLANRTAAVQAALLQARNDIERRTLEADLARTREQERRARQLADRIIEINEQIGTLQRSHAQSTAPAVSAARADLTRRHGSLGSYRMSGAGDAPPNDPSRGNRPLGAGPAHTLGLTMIEVDSVDWSDNPILGKFGRGDVTRADYRWAVQTWADTVGPGAERGMTRDDFAQRDLDRSAPPLRRTAEVYDLFLGGDPIRLSRRADGTLDVVGGRHRLQIARDLGVQHLPAQIFG